MKKIRGTNDAEAVTLPIGSVTSTVGSNYRPESTIVKILLHAVIVVNLHETV